MFFMSYRGPKKSDYSGINKSKQTINHVGIYLGDGRILHTYSKESGGVRIDSIAGKHWEYRFLFGGSAF